jgi:outer membrane protein OmpA-like peptidoglycan-associated protein
LTALNYLVSNGINGTRLTAIGKGETEFIAPNTHPDGSDNPEGRRFNRRVEFEITGTNPDVLIIKRIDPVPKELRIQ